MPTQVVGLATETDTAFGVTAVRTYSLGLVTETDTALAVTSSLTDVSAAAAGLLPCELAGIGIVNSALTKLGVRAITSLIDDLPKAHVCHDVYIDLLDEELRTHVWNFAKSKRRLAQSGIAPVSGFDFAYPLPSDWLRTVGVHGNDAETSRPRYETVGRTIQTDADELWLTYIRRECDASVMDTLFREALANKIAFEIAGSIVGVVSARDRFEDAYRSGVREARSTDAIEDYPEQMPESSWLTVRRR
jgi:hypothetical protein